MGSTPISPSQSDLTAFLRYLLADDPLPHTRDWPYRLQQRIPVIGRSSFDTTPASPFGPGLDRTLPALGVEAGTDRSFNSSLPLHTMASVCMRAFWMRFGNRQGDGWARAHLQSSTEPQTCAERDAARPKLLHDSNRDMIESNASHQS